ncbi:hypothetical protein AAFF_G00293100 [Aldrovandia affinis]|uniref:Uncharacterized protein n=1 Tax=Aldrovandia affinis TaxID=143900 RepID=A0AAD7SQH3_9TELE|nr:hypothetical protein AAFF_G00293100 [Aldrovandia affinis]
MRRGPELEARRLVVSGDSCVGVVIVLPWGGSSVQGPKDVTTDGCIRLIVCGRPAVNESALRRGDCAHVCFSHCERGMSLAAAEENRIGFPFAFLRCPLGLLEPCDGGVLSLLLQADGGRIECLARPFR